MSNFSPKIERLETSALGELLAGRLGLDAQSLGPSFLASAARRSLQHSGYGDLHAFLRAAAAGGEAWQKLVESVVISETWFFRDEVPFAHIANTVRAAWNGGGNSPVRVFSCPCSTGEEAYSVAIALSEAGLPNEAFSIDAADVSSSALKAARAGVFKSRSFRGGHKVDRSRYFHHDSGTQTWRLKPAYREMVQFRPVNLISLDGLDSARRYDIVLCRNLLIYLHPKARSRVMEALWNLLTKDGILIVGHAEPSIAREHGFTGVGDPGAFAFAKANASKARKKTVQDLSNVRPQRNNPLSHLASSFAAARRSPEYAAVANSARAHSTELSLQRIRSLADAGQTEEAMQACRNYVRRVPDSADGYFLLGLLCSALKDDHAAERALRRALYLEPNHAGALMHLALIHDSKHETAAAARLRARANRAAAHRSQA